MSSRQARNVFLRLGSLALALASLWLIGFHVAIFWNRLADATIAQPEVLARWIGAALLIGAVLAFRRYGKLRGRHATVVFWLLVAILHVNVPAEEQIVTLVQAGIVALPAAFLAFALLALTFSVSRTSGLFVVPFFLTPNNERRTQNATRAPPVL